MGGIFSYDSKLSKGFRTVMDAVIMNLLFIVCSLPVVTLGASAAALYSGIRELMRERKEEDSEKEPIRVFLKAFKEGFRTITALSAICTALIAALGYNLILVLVYHYSGLNAPVILSLIGLALIWVFWCSASLMHANFSCRFGLLCRNAFNLMFAYPIRAVVTAALLLLPPAVGLFNMYYLLMGMPVWILVYFSLSMMTVRLMWRRVFEKLKSVAVIEET